VLILASFQEEPMDGMTAKGCEILQSQGSPASSMQVWWKGQSLAPLMLFGAWRDVLQSLVYRKTAGG